MKNLFFVSLHAINIQVILTKCYRFVSGAMRKLFLIYLFVSSVVSCYREVPFEEADADRFDLSVSQEMQQFIYDSRDTTYAIEDASLGLSFNDEAIELKEIRVRGKSATRFQRKSYVVFLSEAIQVLDRFGGGVKDLSRFKLIALAMDYTYIENRLAFGILEEVGVMPLFFKFVEFRINDQTQGVYLLLEDPEAYYKEIGSEFILRREYNHRIDDTDYDPAAYHIPYPDYENRFHQIYNSLTRFQGEELYRELSDRLDLGLYFRKMGIDYLLKNGDYTDELYLYTRVARDTIRFYPIPWDYDDLFSDLPHEVRVSWGTGTLFGKRSYESMEDVYEDVGEKLIFSIEDDLDYAIAKDSVLYSYYIHELKDLFQEVDRDLIERIFLQTETELSTFYNSISVVEQSQHDRDMTTRELWIENMSDKKGLILRRLEAMQQQVNEIQ